MTRRNVTIRASSLAELFDCPARWEAKHLLGMRLPSSGAAHLGTAVHASTAAFDQAVLDGAPISANDAAGALVDKIHDKDADVDWEDSNAATAERIGLALHARYCAEIAPQQHYIGVEIKCDALEIPELALVLTGSTDRVRTTPDGAGISDLKTGGRAVGADGIAATAGHGPQLGLYELLAEHAMGIPISAPAQIVGLNTGKTAAAQRVGVGEIESPRSTLLGTEEQPGLLQHASQLIHSGTFYGNGKSVLCSAKYCPRHATCTYKS